MTTDDLASRLLAAGFEPADAEGRARLAADAIRGFREATGREPAWGWFVPGRIEVFGKHTDYAGGRSLVAAVPRGFAIVGAPRDDRGVRVVDARWRDRMEIDAGDADTVYRGWANYVAVVVRRLGFNFPGGALGADLAFASDLPRAAGLSSSSALVVAVATALIRRGALDRREDFRQALPTVHDLAGYLGAVENGLAYGALASLHGVGTHGGSEDHNAVRHLGDAALPGSWRFVVASSGVQADKAGSARERYNRASLLTRALLELWTAATGDGPTTLAAALASAPGAEERLREIVRRHAHEAFEGVDLDRRLTHFIGEDARVMAAAAAVRAADRPAVGALAAASQQDADRLLGNQIDETRTLAALATAEGAFAASSFGAGFGGSVWAMVDDADPAGFAERWVAAYRAACPQVERVEWFVTRPTPAVTDLGVGA